MVVVETDGAPTPHPPARSLHNAVIPLSPLLERTLTSHGSSRNDDLAWKIRRSLLTPCLE